MKAFIFAYNTNYGLGAAIIYAETKDEAIRLSKTKGYAYIWNSNNILEIDTNTNSKVIIIGEDNFQEIK